MVILMSDYSFATDVLTSRTFFPMTNVIQPYSWGSRHSLKALFNISNPECAPQAEALDGYPPQRRVNHFIVWAKHVIVRRNITRPRTILKSNYCSEIR